VTHSGGPDFAYDLCVRKTTPDQRLALDLRSWAVAYNGAEPIHPEVLSRFADAFKPAGFRPLAFYPAYGLAEATLKVTGGRKSDPPVYRAVDADALERNQVLIRPGDAIAVRRLVGCGSASAGSSVSIVDPETDAECESDVVGEIWVSGPGVAQGYWNRPQESEQVFRAFTSAGKGPYLRTGDLGFVSEGELYVTGRLKDLIIIRGRNIYPQDIEATAGRCHTALRPGGAAAFSIEDADQERLVIVHELESRKIENGEEIASAIRRAVGESYDIQVWRVALIKPGALPRTSSGKTQRKLCRKLFLARELESIAEYLLDSNQADQYPPDAPEEYAGADSSIPILVRKIVARTLGIPQTSVSMSDPISSYGIDSLASIEIAHGIETQLGWHVPMATLLDGTSILQITSSIASGAFPPERQIPLEPGIQSRESKARSRESKYQLSRGQQAIWFLYQLDPLSVAYNIAGAVRITSGL
ncbi:MAG: AMP-binding protein, partial [Blastocatellia bacterium]